MCNMGIETPVAYLFGMLSLPFFFIVKASVAHCMMNIFKIRMPILEMNLTHMTSSVVYLRSQE